MPTYCEFGVDWDADALRASKVPYPYTSDEFFDYFKDFVNEGARVLEVGCQIASWYQAFKDLKKNIRYEGLDFSPVAIAIARQRYPACKFHLLNAKEMAFNEEYDVVFTHTFYQHTSLETKKIVVPKVWKALKLGGFHIIQENTSLNSESTWLKDEWIDFFTKHDFQIIKTHDIGGGGTGFVFRK